MTTEGQRLYVIDAHAYLHRAYHALPPLTTSKGEPVGALYGFAKMLLSIIRRERPDFLAVCFDSPGLTFRHKVYKEYKATREEVDEDLVKQLAMAEEMVRAMGLSTVAAPGYEADDLLAAFAGEGTREGLRVVLVSGDKDALQLVGGEVLVLNEAKGVLYDAAGVFEKFKVRPEQLADYLAIVGDSSDNVPGVRGLGPVAAVKLLGKFGTLDRVLEAARRGNGDITPKAAKALVEHADDALLSRKLILLDAGAPTGTKPRDCRVALKPSDALVKLFGRLEFNSLLRELTPGGGLEPRAPATEAETPLKLAFKPADPGKLLKAAKRADALSVAAAKPEQPDLLHAAAPMVALGLPDGRAAAFADADFEKHRADLEKLLTAPKPAKIAHDLKSLKRLLREAGIELAGGAADTMLAAYCLDPGRGKYAVDQVLVDLGAGALPPEDPAVGLARRASAVWALRERLEGWLKEAKLEGLYRDFELPMVDVLADMESSGIALDGAYLKRLRKEFDGKILELKREIDKLAGVEINLKSTKQLAAFFYDTLGLPVVHKTKKGGRSTDEEALRVLASKHPAPAKIMEYRELTKLQSTYVVALFEKMDPDTGRVHSHFNQAGTATGRLSSLDPNLQNIPVRTALGRKIRRAFRAGKGRVLLSADYSQIDLRVLAHLSGDKVLRDAFARGDDIHLRTAAEVFGVAPAGVDKEMRRRAKAVNFGIVYGQTPHGLAAELGIPRPEAQDIIKRYFARYEGVGRWIEATLKAARRDGKVKTMSGRVRYLPDIKARNFAARSFNERVAVNTPIQGGSADIIKAAMINIHRKMSGSRKWKARLVLQVHDELIFELPKTEVKAFGKWVRREMETAMKLDVPVVVDLQTGADWLGMEALKA